MIYRGMTRDEFEEMLLGKRYPYKEENGGIIIGGENKSIFMNHLTSIPEGVHFRNDGDVYMNSLLELPGRITFENNGFVSLNVLTRMSGDARFNNRGFIHCPMLVKFPKGVEINNRGEVYIKDINDSSGICLVSGVDAKRMMMVLVNKVHGND
jgi:hypothetical protein